MSVLIREIKEEDTPGYWKALASVAAERKFILTIDPPPLEETASFVKNNIENGHPHFVAVHGETIVGWADIIPFRHSTMSHAGGLGMAVIADYRGQGLGGRLLKAVIEAAWSTGLKRLELEVFADNLTAIKLYEKHGYEKEGLKRFARFIDGEYQDILVMGQYRT